MQKLKVLLAGAALLFSIAAFSQSAEKYISSKSHIKFFSTTPVEDIEANNYASVSTINPKTGAVVFSVPMQSFEFEKAMMQKHFNNEHFLESSVYPKSKLKGMITNLSDIDFNKDGKYEANFEGEITIKDKTQKLEDSGTITVAGGSLTLDTTFDLTLGDFGITFDEGEMVSTKIAKSVEVSVKSEYQSN
ncbi:MAG: YceI family protein [Prolixibacteraceae bacterium]|jgi:polyisoprenoid-binding protein YceI|nr:YceI family protein [Prolixibacteraceae bacterium]MBT6005955.1 YceI family protein [Prolixibacteraceae bacterium]MBT6766317.1 YceI family protein [Prolixibacteraceae bacterium]MBT6997716.1 YceI family protein [Prolixibacteraceae bacterium]MBT7395337.1 YceI family protein [Prolixibacteraceae bacterium]